MAFLTNLVKVAASLFLLILLYFGPFILIAYFVPHIEVEDDEGSYAGSLAAISSAITMIVYGVYHETDYSKEHKNLHFTPYWVISSIVIFGLAGYFAFKSEPAAIVLIPLIKTAFVVLIVSGVFAFVETYFPESINKLFKLLNPK